MSSSKPFPEGFLLGSSTSAHQIEGCWQCDDKGLNIWDYLTNYQDGFNLENANEACKSYPDFYKDVECAKEIGFDFYRFSISWSRILKGNGERTMANINPIGIKYYNDLITELLANGIEPMVTMYHWDLPQSIQEDFGGWTNSVIVDYMEGYADLLFKSFGDKVKYWITINEPQMVVTGYENGGPNQMKMAPGKSLPSPANYIVAHNILKAHARIYHLYDQKYRPTQQGKIGFSIIASCYRSLTSDPEDEKAVEIANAFNLGLFADPIFTKEGDYPEIVRKIVDENSKKEGRIRSRLPKFTDEEKKSLIGSADFFAMNHYITFLCSPAPNNKYSVVKAPPKLLHYATRSDHEIAFFKEDLNVTITPFENPPPDGFQEILKYIKDHYGNPPIFVTENGLGERVIDGNPPPGIHDISRVEYFKDFLGALLKAIYEDECNVIGYTAWSLMDNFEWGSGYKMKFGVSYINFENPDPEMKRILKDSAKYLQHVLETRHL